MAEKEYPAYLVVRRLGTDEEIERIGVSYLNEYYVDRVMTGILINMNKDEFFIDDSEVDAARERANKSREEGS